MRNFTKVLAAVWQVPNNGMYVRPSRHLTHVQIGSTTITMSQYQMACLTFRPNFELITPPSLTSAFIHFFEANMLTFQILSDKYCCTLNILALKFNAKCIISTCKRGKEHGASTS